MKKELLVEIYTEDIPANMQKGALERTSPLLSNILKSNSIDRDSIIPFISKNRIGFCVKGIKEEIKIEEQLKRGPRISSDKKNLEGFLRSNFADDSDLIKKDDFYYIKQDAYCINTVVLIPKIIERFLKEFYWPKNMYWPNEFDREKKTASWVRPIRSVLCVFGGEHLNFTVDDYGIKTCFETLGSGILDKKKVTIDCFDDYEQKLLQCGIISRYEDRLERISDLLKASSCDILLNNDEDLLNETTGLVNFPQVFVGKINENFMVLPRKVLITSMKNHQKFFSFNKKSNDTCYNANDNTSNNTVCDIAPYFAIVSDLYVTEKSLSGYEKVLNARLSDALFFYNQDIKVPLENNVKKLDKITFHEKLGSYGDKIKRLLNNDLSDEEKRAILLCKTDLVTNMVQEFPELQGYMGGIYAKIQGEDSAIAVAIEEHYRPLSSNGLLPGTEIGLYVSILDKIDTLVGFLGVGIKPKGSGDPFALRRTAISIIRILIEKKEIEEKYLDLLYKSVESYNKQGIILSKNIIKDALSFMGDRFFVWLKSCGFDHDLIKAVLNTDHNNELINSKKFEINFSKTISVIKFFSSFLKEQKGIETLLAYKRSYGLLASANALNNKIESDANACNLSRKAHDILCENFWNDMFCEAKKISEFCDNTKILSDNVEEQTNNILMLAKFRSTIKKVINLDVFCS